MANEQNKGPKGRLGGKKGRKGTSRKKDNPATRASDEKRVVYSRRTASIGGGERGEKVTLEGDIDTLLRLYGEWLADSAGRVHEFLRTPAVMRTFRDMVRKYVELQGEREKANAEWHKKRKEHFETIIPNTPQLQDRETPPAGDYVWYYDDYGREGWTPTELISEPDVSRPLPLPKRELAIEEKYAVLAAIHDHIYKQQRVNPWPKDEVGLLDMPGTDYWTLIYEAAKLRTKEEQKVVQDCLDAVRVDLRLPVEDGGGAEEEPKEKAQGGKRGETGRPPKYRDDDRNRMRTLHDEYFSESNDSAGAWSRVGEIYGCSGDAARKACAKKPDKLEKRTK